MRFFITYQVLRGTRYVNMVWGGLLWKRSHPIDLIQLFAFILKVKYSKGFRGRGALRVCNGPVDGVPVRGMLRNQVFYFGAKPPAS